LSQPLTLLIDCEPFGHQPAPMGTLVGQGPLAVAVCHSDGQTSEGPGPDAG
jgi:hypothetical protein